MSECKVDPLLPPPGRLKLLLPEIIEKVTHEEDLAGIGFDSLGRLSLVVNGEGIRVTMTPLQMVHIAVRLAAIAEKLAADSVSAADVANNALWSLLAERAAGNA